MKLYKINLQDMFDYEKEFVQFTTDEKLAQSLEDYSGTAKLGYHVYIQEINLEEEDK